MDATMRKREQKTCPYCGDTECEADYVDVEVGFVQCAPFYCRACGACEIGAHDEPHPLDPDEERTGWYKPGRSHLTSAPTLGGVPVGHGDAVELYRLGLLDKIGGESMDGAEW